MQLFKIFIFAPLLLTLVACSVPSPEKRETEADSGTFYIRDVRSEFTTITRHQTFSVPVSKTLSTKACFSDNKNSRPVRLHRFEIKNPNRTFELTSDDDGCVLWQEEIEYNALQDARLIKIDRSAKAVGLEKGNRTIELIANPWAGTVLPLKGSQARENSYVAESAESLMGERHFKKPISFDQGRITIQPLSTQGNQRRVALELVGSVSVESKNVDGQSVQIPLNRGQFKYQITLFYQADQESKSRRTLIYRTPTKELRELMQGQIQIAEEFDLSEGALCSAGTVYVGLKLEPLSGPRGLEKIETVFHYGPCETRGTAFATQVASFRQRFERDSRFTVDQFLAEDPSQSPSESPQNQASPQSPSPLQPGNSNPSQPQVRPGGLVPTPSRPGVRPQAWQVSQLRAETKNYIYVGGSERKRNIEITACIRSHQDQRPLRMTSLEVETFSGEKITVPATNNDGCFTFDNQVTYNYLGQECWSEGRVVISNPASQFSEPIPVQLNPWAEFDIFRDGRYINQGSQTNQARCANGPSEIIVQSYKFQKQSIDYNIDDFMNLEVRKNGPFTLNLKMKRPSLIEGSGFRMEDIPANLKFFARIAVVDQFLQDLNQAKGKIYSYQEKILTVRGASEIVETLSLATKNIKARGNTNRILIEILPLKSNAEELLKDNPNLSSEALIDSQTHVARQVYSAPIRIAGENESADLQLYPTQGGGLESLRQQWQEDEREKQQRLAQTASPEFFAQQEFLMALKINDEASTAQLRTALANPNAFASSRPGRNQALTTQDLLQWIEQGKQHPLNKTHLCSYWFNDLWKRPLAGKSHGILDPRTESRVLHLVSRCQQMTAQDPRSVFDLETKYFLKKPQLAAINDVAVPARDFSVSYGFSMGRSESNSLSRSYSWDLSLGLRGGHFLSLGTGGSYSISRSQSQTSNQGADVGYSASTALAIETLGLKIKPESYQKCLVVRLNSHLFTNEAAALWREALHGQLSAEEKIQAIKTGLLLCEGIDRQDDRTFDENYYVINQNLPETQVLDQTTERNRPFFMAIRGELDFLRFIAILHSAQEAPQVFSAEFQRQRIGQEPMSAVFFRGSPSYPGMLSRQE